MMPAWVSSTLRPIPRDRTVFVRFFGVMFDAGYSKWKDQWFALEPGGREREIEDPTIWWDQSAPDISKEEERLLVFGPETTNARPLRGARQLDLSFLGGDSVSLSAAAGGSRRAG
jgi:hypothetical protein